MTAPNKNIFYAEVYDIVRQIPKGKVLTYGRIAKLIGYPNHSRMVGKAMVNAPDGNDIPCHRVVHSNGGTCPAWKEQQALLEQEGVQFKQNGTIDMNKYLWQIEE